MRPTAVTKRGDWLQVLEKPSSIGAWLLSTEDASSNKIQYHLNLLLDLISPKGQIISELKEAGYTVSISCYALTEHENVEGHIDSATIRRIADLDCNFWFDVYFDYTEFDEDQSESLIENASVD